MTFDIQNFGPVLKRGQWLINEITGRWQYGDCCCGDAAGHSDPLIPTGCFERMPCSVCKCCSVDQYVAIIRGGTGVGLEPNPDYDETTLNDNFTLLRVDDDTWQLTVADSNDEDIDFFRVTLDRTGTACRDGSLLLERQVGGGWTTVHSASVAYSSIMGKRTVCCLGPSPYYQTTDSFSFIIKPAVDGDTYGVEISFNSVSLDSFAASCHVEEHAGIGPGPYFRAHKFTGLTMPTTGGPITHGGDGGACGVLMDGGSASISIWTSQCPHHCDGEYGPGATITGDFCSGDEPDYFSSTHSDDFVVYMLMSTVTDKLHLTARWNSNLTSAVGHSYIDWEGPPVTTVTELEHAAGQGELFAFDGDVDIDNASQPCADHTYTIPNNHIADHSVHNRIGNAAMTATVVIGAG